MKSKRKEIEQEFAQWWNDRVFYINPFYEIYRKLHARGADLDYIHFLRGVFVWGAKFDPQILRETSRRARKRNQKANRHTGPDSATIAVIRDIERLHLLAKEQGPDPMVLVGELRILIERLHKVTPSSKPLAYLLRRLVLNEVLQQVEERARMMRRDLLRPVQCLDERASVALQKSLDAFPNVCEKLKLLWLPERGQQPDPLGGFILLAVTEHLREKRGPSYALAAQFLGRLRGLSASRKDTLGAKARVHQLRSRRDWNEILEFAKQQYHEAQEAAKAIPHNVIQPLPA
jgi:hypothetical protein